MKSTNLRAAVLIPIMLTLALGAFAAAPDFDADRALRDPAFAKALQSLDSQDSATKAFETHGVRAFGISNQLIGFLDALAGGQYTTQIEKLMDVPVQQWNANRGWSGSYDIVNVKRIVNQNQQSSLFGSVKDKMGHVATAVSCIQVGRDIAKAVQGDDAAKLNSIYGTYNIVQGFLIKDLALESLGTAMMGVGFLSFALTEFQSTAQQVYEDYWWIAYTNYMEKTYPKLVTGDDSWAAVAKSQGYDGVKRRLYSFWDDPYTNAGTHYGKAGIQTSPDMAKRTLSDKFAAAYYRNSVHTTLKTYFQLQAEQAEARARIEGRRRWNEMMALLNDAEQLRLAILDASDLEDAALSELTVTAPDGTYRQGDTVTFTATAVDVEGREANVSDLCDWSGNAPGGVVDEAPGGSLTVTATIGERSGSATVSVVAATGLTCPPSPAKLKPGESVTFTAEVAWDDGETRDVSAEAAWGVGLEGGRFEGTLEPQVNSWRVDWKGLTAWAEAEVLPPTSVVVSPASVRLKPGESAEFTAEAVYDSGDRVDITNEATWNGTTSGPIFEAPEPGIAVIEAVYLSVSGTASIDIMGPDGLVVAPASAELRLGETQEFTATANWPDGVSEDVTAEADWPPEVAGGAFVADQPGQVFFVVDYLGQQASASVEVTGPTGLTLSPASASIRMNETVTFTATAEFADGTTQDVTELVTFTGCGADGTFTPERTGSATVTATYGDQSASATVDVVGPDQLFLEPADASIEAGEQVTFTTTAHFPDGSVDDVTAAAAYVNAPGGVFAGTTAGRTTVTATYGGLSASATVEVKNGGTLALSPASAECEMEGTVSFTARVVRDDGSSEDVSGQVTWQGADGGVFTARTPGEAVVTAALGGLTASARVTVEQGDGDVTLDEAADEIGDEDTDELCSVDEMRVAIAMVRGLLAESESQFASFKTFSTKFDKELADRAADPCGNSLLAFCYASAQTAAADLAATRSSIRDAATTLLTMQAWCPETAAGVEGAFDGQSIVSELAAVGAAHAYAQQRLGGMAGRLAEYGCDENEMDQIADSRTEQDMDPDLLQDGGAMQEIGGDGVDNDSDGMQEENVEALSGYNVTIVVYDSGMAKDDVFNLSVTGAGNLGSTPAGGLRSYGLNLPPGSYNAVVTVVVAPDNVGTFTIVVMENGVSIASGSGDPGQGATFNLPFTVTGDGEE